MLLAARRCSLIFILSVLLSNSFNTARAQELNCDQLQQLISIIASDSTMASLRTTRRDVNYSKKPEYGSSLAFMTSGSTFYNDVTYLGYNDAEQHYSYFTIHQNSNDKNAQLMFRLKIGECIGKGWVLTTKTEGTSEAWYFKNTNNYVVIKMSAEHGQTIECYNDAKHKDPECVFGDCRTYLGQLHQFNEDTYTGTFLDGGITGYGRVDWHATQNAFEGSFIEGQINGYGKKIDPLHRVSDSGFYYKGSLIKLDTNQKGCQQGNCQTGFGLYVSRGNVYIGNFKDGGVNGIGELIVKDGTFYGYFADKKMNGKFIYLTAGSATGEFDNFTNGDKTGPYEVLYPGTGSIEGVSGSNMVNLFGEDGLLLKSGAQVNGTIHEKTDVAYLNLKAFAKSIKDFYANRSTGYSALKGQPNKLLMNLGLGQVYKSTKPLANSSETNIETDKSGQYYITADLNGKTENKAIWIAAYNKYYDMLHRATGNSWVPPKDEGHVNANTTESSFVIRHVFDRTKVIKLTYSNKNGVQMEIH